MDDSGVVYVVFVFQVFFQWYGNDFYIIVWVGVKVMAFVDYVIVEYFKYFKVYLVWVVVVGEVEGMMGVELVMIGVAVGIGFVDYGFYDF